MRHTVPRGRSRKLMMTGAALSATGKIICLAVGTEYPYHGDQVRTAFSRTTTCPGERLSCIAEPVTLPFAPRPNSAHLSSPAFLNNLEGCLEGWNSLPTPILPVQVQSLTLLARSRLMAYQSLLRHGLWYPLCPDFHTTPRRVYLGKFRR